MTERQFPDAEERTRIMARRNQLHRDLLEYIVTRSPNEQQARAQFNPLAREYGFDEVYRMLQKISPLLNRPKDPDVEDVFLYNQYVEIYNASFFLRNRCWSARRRGACSKNVEQ